MCGHAAVMFPDILLISTRLQQGEGVQDAGTFDWTSLLCFLLVVLRLWGLFTNSFIK
jgi:hypothetical protein